jgi:ribosomal peptide maturation radical SAM protein 1
MLPYASAAEKRKAYAILTERAFFPWNEWAFSRWIFPLDLRRRDPEVLARLAALDTTLAGQTGHIRPSELILFICNSVPRYISEMVDQLAAFDLIGISTTFFQNGPALALARHLKNRWPKKIIVLGGANCDGEMGRGLFEKFTFLDFVFSGEVDHSFPEFVERLAKEEVINETPGLIYRGQDGQVLEGPRAVPAQNMNELPIPDFDDYVTEWKQFGHYVDGEIILPLESSRGCWWGAKHHCTFCGLNANGMGYRQKDPERFRGEVQAIVDRYQARYLFMADNILSMKYYKDFIQWTKQRRLNVDFFYEIKANVSRQQVADLAEAGVTMVQPGIESFSSKTLRLMRKGVRGIQNIAFLKYAAEYGVLAAYNLLAGFPGEDPFEYEHMTRELPKLLHLQPPNGLTFVEFHRFSPYHNDPEQFGIRLHPHENYSYIYPFEESDLGKLAYFFELEGRTPFDLSYLAEIQTAVSEWRKIYTVDECKLTWRRDGEDIIVRDRRPGLGPRIYRLRNCAVDVFEAFDAPTSVETAARLISRASVEGLEQGFNPSSRSRWSSVEELSPQPMPGVPYYARWPSSDNWFWTDPRVTGIATEKIISFSSNQFLANPAACLAELVSAGLIYNDEGLFLALPVSEQHRRTQSGWGQIGI